MQNICFILLFVRINSLSLKKCFCIAVWCSAVAVRALRLWCSGGPNVLMVGLICPNGGSYLLYFQTSISLIEQCLATITTLVQLDFITISQCTASQSDLLGIRLMGLCIPTH